MQDSIDWDERKDAIRGRLAEMRRWQQEKMLELRADLIEQLDEIKALPKEEQKQRKKELQAVQLEFKRLHDEQADLEKALEDEFKEISRLEKLEGGKPKKAFVLGFALNLGKPKDRRTPNDDAIGLEHLPDRGDTEARKGFLKMHILAVLAEGPSHGYEITRRISRHTMDTWTPSPGSMYPALEALESKGFVSCQGDGRRKVYSLTPKGQNVLDQIMKMRENQSYEMKTYMSTLLGE